MSRWEDGFNDEWEDFDEFPERLHSEWPEETGTLIEPDEQPPESDENIHPEHRKLWQELQAEALTRLEAAAKTPTDFQKILEWWDKLDANRERRERYHEILRSGDALPLDYGSAENGAVFPDEIDHALAGQLQKGDFIDAIFNCPYEIHELVTDAGISAILKGLKEEQKELLFLWAVRFYSSTKIAALRGQSDRNIRKVRTTLLKQIHKKLLAAIQEKAGKNMPLTLEEKAFLAKNGKNSLDGK